MTVLDRLTNPLVTWTLGRCLRTVDALPASKRVRYLLNASRGVLIGIGTAIFGVCGSVLLGLFCTYCYATYPVSPPEYPASMWVLFGVISMLVCLGHVLLGVVCVDLRRRLKPFVTPLG